ncbi:MAG: glycosyltransferase [Denitromonas halophila]|nr:MAG: glycosyltransferase [Denitromonas halophila]
MEMNSLVVPALTVIIKTLNEERNIQRCIESIFVELKGLSIEVIVADSGSIDGTVDIASRFPVSVVQLKNKDEKSCGIGHQLGFQYSRGKYILVLDADMVVCGDFVKAALDRMSSDSQCGGVGGQLVERTGVGYEYDLRQRQVGSVDIDAEVKWLDGSALYRRDAILDVGYLTNRNLHAFEEKELGLRLRAAGWHLCKYPMVAVEHYGYAIDSWRLLLRRWNSGYADACGESVKACVFQPYFLEMVFVHKSIFATLIFQIMFIFAGVVSYWTVAPLFLCVAFLLAGSAVQVLRKQSVERGLYSVVYLNLFSLGLVRGLFKPQVDPRTPIQSSLLSSPKMLIGPGSGPVESGA